MSLLQIIISIFVGILMAGGLFSINLAVRGIDRKFNLYYFLIVTGMSLFLILSLISYYITEIDDFIFVEKAINVVLLLSCLALILLVQEISNYRNKNVVLVLTIPLILFLIINFFRKYGISIDELVQINKTEIYYGEKLNKYEIIQSVWLEFIKLYLAVLLLYIIKAIHFAYNNKRRKDALLLLISFMPVVISLGITISFFDQQSVNVNFILEISFVLFAIILSSKNYNDIINYSRVSKALEESESRFRTLFEKSADPMLLIQGNEFIDCNEAAAKILNYESIEDLKKITPDQISPEYQPDGQLSRTKAQELIALTKIRGSHNFEWIHTTKEGIELWIEVTLTLLPFEKNDLIFVSWRNITDRKKAEEDLISAKEKAENSEKVKTAFLAQMSHEIRSPLFGILSYISLIKEGLVEGNLDKTESEQYFKTIELSSARLIRTIDLILNMSELQTLSYNPIFTMLDLNPLLSNLLDEYLETANKKNIKLSFSAELPVTNVTCDEYSVNQIFANLIDNAIKYTEEGEIKISIELNSESKIIVKIIDTGIGMSDDFLSNLFTPFTQEEIGYTRKYEGNGLGLALVKNYCQINNIDLAVKSKKGIGTEFKLTFQ
jgi:PAS domain S-box-containing protein